MNPGNLANSEPELKSKVDLYLKKAKDSFENLELQDSWETDVKSIENIERITQEFQQMTICYYKDALHFYNMGNYVNALAALEYAEGWLDAGKMLGIFK